MTLITKKKLCSVSRSSPCRVCGGDHKCSRGGDGLIMCGRRSGPQPGFVDLGAAKGDPQFHLYRSENDPALNRDQIYPPEPKIAPRSSVDWPALAKQLAGNMTPALADGLCERLGLPRLALDALPMIGYDGKAWTFPEVDGQYEIVGIVRRFPDGRKKAMPGSRRGLTVPLHWSERGTPLLIVEGQSDALALSLCGVSCIGRPSNTGGAEMLAELLTDFPPDRPIVVMGENDEKPDGTWPGRDGAVHIAKALAAKLQRRISWALPPAGAKDIRAWILSQQPDPTILDAWHEIGDKLWV